MSEPAVGIVVEVVDGAPTGIYALPALFDLNPSQGAENANDVSDEKRSSGPHDGVRVIDGQQFVHGPILVQERPG